eukprot:scaffold2448_cov250-Pinguiococcus_pyrenoidosus.AAC.20
MSRLVLHTVWPHRFVPVFFCPNLFCPNLFFPNLFFPNLLRRLSCFIHALTGESTLRQKTKRPRRRPPESLWRYAQEDMRGGVRPVCPDGRIMAAKTGPSRHRRCRKSTLYAVVSERRRRCFERDTGGSS